MKNLRNLFTGVALTALVSGCQSTEPVYTPTYSEGPDYSGQRTPIYAQPMDCTVITRREGRVYGGQTVYGTGEARETCVSVPRDEYGRASPIEDANRTIRDTQRMINSIYRLQRTFDAF